MWTTLFGWLSREFGGVREMGADTVEDVAGRTTIPMVKCASCPWRIGCPDACKRREAAKPVPPWSKTK